MANAGSITVVGALGGSLILISPASTTLAMPDDVPSKLEKEYPPKFKTAWRLGDPPLETADPKSKKRTRATEVS